VLNSDYFTVPEREIRKVKPLLTMVGGKIVFQADNF
jgi:predicted amidohydrolase YtcJ